MWRHFFDRRDIGAHILYVIILWRLLSAKDFAQMQYSQKRLVMDFYLQFFSSNLDFTSDPSQVFRFLVYLTKITFWDSKSGFSYPDRSCVSSFKQNRDNPDEIGMIGHSAISISTHDHYQYRHISLSISQSMSLSLSISQYKYVDYHSFICVDNIEFRNPALVNSTVIDKLVRNRMSLLTYVVRYNSTSKIPSIRLTVC